MTKPIPDYEAEYRKWLLKNQSDLEADLRNPSRNLKQKIQNYADKWDYDYNEVLQNARQDEMFGNTFAKDPLKQNLAEKIAAEFIESIDFIADFRNLSSAEKVIVNGAVHSGKDHKAKGGQTKAKSLDFEWKLGSKTVYASHKYTREGGGAQDNQYSDLLSFIDDANQSQRDDEVFIAIADGEYYKNASSGKSKLDEMKQRANSSNGVYAVSIDELEELLIRLNG